GDDPATICPGTPLGTPAPVWVELNPVTVEVPAAPEPKMPVVAKRVPLTPGVLLGAPPTQHCPLESRRNTSVLIPAAGHVVTRNAAPDAVFASMRDSSVTPL